MSDASRRSTGFAVLRRAANEGGYFRPIIKEVVERYLDCGNPRSGIARIRCPDCHAEYLPTFSCKTRGFCPSCHAKRLEEWVEWIRERLLLDVPHRQIVSWRHTGFNVHSRVRAKTKLEAERVGKYMIRPVLALERLQFLDREAAELETMDYLEFIARVTSHIPDKGQVMVRYYGLYANAHRGKVRKANRVPVALGMIEEEPRPIPSKGWAEGTIPAIRAANPAQELRQAGS